MERYGIFLFIVLLWGQYLFCFFNMNTISQAIKNYNNNQFHNYYLNGDDVFLEKFFINQINQKFIGNDGQKILYHFSVDNESDFFNNLNSQSLFNSKKMIVCWDINKLSKQGKKEFIDYVESNPSKDVALIVIYPGFRVKNKFISDLTRILTTVDVRTPFPGKMKNWVKFYTKVKNIRMTNDLINFYIDYFGDSLSNVIGEINKHSMYSENKSLDIADDYGNYVKSDRNYSYWQFLDSVGKKKLLRALNIYRSMVENGMSHNYILSGLSNLFINIYIKNNSLNCINDFPLMNKILINNMNIYSSNFNSEESLALLNYLHKIDKMVKTFKYGVNLNFELFILKVCSE
ncbi:MAG: hypothetical protein CMG00_06665 [Candidatus Marinimicrobia bacterium]|nr:hypothetical protein [Candidatus Neomarinimicrobiota bacterium]